MFKDEILQEDYFKDPKLGTYMAMQKKACMTAFLFKEFLYLFKRSILDEIFLTNYYLLILDGHGSHVTLRQKSKPISLVWTWFTLSLHASRILQLLDVLCFKTERHGAMTKKCILS
jgi:hypothetical protein